MSYIIQPDLNRSIQEANLNQIIGNDPSILSGAILAAEAEAKSYLRQKYDIEKEFTETSIWDLTKTYYAADRFYLSAPTFNPANTYPLNSLVTYNSIVYKCISPVTVPAAFYDGNWLAIGNQYTLFFATFPEKPFTYGGLYNVGDKVFWKNSVYTCLIQTPLLDHDTGLQYRIIQNLPLANPAPDDIQNGRATWGIGIPYSIAAGTLPTDATKYTQADNRDAQMVLYLIDLALYHIHSRIAPRNIPDLRIKRYDDAIKWLRMAANGDVTITIPVIEPHQGNRIRFGGNIKQINSY